MKKMAKIDYNYNECGLDNVILKDLDALINNAGDQVVRIPAINALHKVLLEAVAVKEGGLNGKEIRFIRTELGLTQSELAKLLGKDGQTIGRWERGENPIEQSADTLVRIMAIQHLNGGVIPSIDELAMKSTPSSIQKPYIIDSKDPKNYKLVA